MAAGPAPPSGRRCTARIPLVLLLRTAGHLNTSFVYRTARGLVATAALLASAGCSTMGGWLPDMRSADSFLGVITPYRMDIVQGNVVTREQAAQVKPGMPRAQVRDILGSPMLTDVFHGDRWDYAFTIRRQGTQAQRRSVVAYFKDDRLERLEAGDLPSEHEFVTAISRPPRSENVPKLELTAEQRKALPAPASASAPASNTPLGAVREYPPLEPS